jgi:hypothetical protein
MDKQAVKDLMFGGLNELMANSKYYYSSTIGGGSYSHFTEEGKQALLEYMDLIGWKLKQAEEVELNQRAKELVIKGLKGEKT